MPDGDNYNSQERGILGNYGRGAKLVDNVQFGQAEAGVYVGPWVDISTLKAASAEVVASGNFVGNVNIEGTNSGNPTTATAGNALCAPLTASGLAAMSVMPVRYGRVRITDFTAGSVSVNMHGVS